MSRKSTIIKIIVIIFILIASTHVIDAYGATNRNDEKDIIKVLSKTIESTINTAEKLEKEYNEQQAKIEEQRWKTYENIRLTEYCPYCNSPSGSYQSASGVYLEQGHIACSWLDIGTRVIIDDIEYTVVDICGTDAVDIFVDSSYCNCTLNKYTTIKVYEQ